MLYKTWDSRINWIDLGGQRSSSLKPHKWSFELLKTDKTWQKFKMKQCDDHRDSELINFSWTIILYSLWHLDSECMVSSYYHPCLNHCLLSWLLQSVLLKPASLVNYLLKIFYQVFTMSLNLNRYLRFVFILNAALQ